jgi:hypothetical protein
VRPRPGPVAPVAGCRSPMPIATRAPIHLKVVPGGGRSGAEGVVRGSCAQTMLRLARPAAPPARTQAARVARDQGPTPARRQAIGRAGAATLVPAAGNPPLAASQRERDFGLKGLQAPPGLLAITRCALFAPPVPPRVDARSGRLSPLRGLYKSIGVPRAVGRCREAKAGSPRRGGYCARPVCARRPAAFAAALGRCPRRRVRRVGGRWAWAVAARGFCKRGELPCAAASVRLKRSSSPRARQAQLTSPEAYEAEARPRRVLEGWRHRSRGPTLFVTNRRFCDEACRTHVFSRGVRDDARQAAFSSARNQALRQRTRRAGDAGRHPGSIIEEEITAGELLTKMRVHAHRVTQPIGDALITAQAGNGQTCGAVDHAMEGRGGPRRGWAGS